MALTHIPVMEEVPDQTQQHPAATLGDTTQVAVQLAAQIFPTVPASTEVLQPRAAGSDCADMDSAPKRPRVGNQPTACAASIMEQGFAIVPNPRGHIANVRKTFERAASLKQKCAQFSPIGQMYPGPEFGSRPNIGDGKRQTADSKGECTWSNALLILLHLIFASYELSSQVLELEGDELPQFLETSMLRSLVGVQVQGGHCDTAPACEKFMQHGPRGRPDGIVVISPIDGASNVFILKNWAGSKVPTAEEFAAHATRIDIPADHTLLMSDHMPHAGGDIAGRRAHAIITRPDLAKRTYSEKTTYWLKPAGVGEIIEG